jgi:hypothetical protein
LSVQPIFEEIGEIAASLSLSPRDEVVQALDSITINDPSGPSIFSRPMR